MGPRVDGRAEHGVVMRVDAHHHYFWPGRGEYPWMVGPAYEVLRRDLGPEALAPALDAHRIDATVIVQTWSSFDETRHFLELASCSPHVCGVVGWVDLTAGDVGERIGELRDGPGGDRLVGIRHQVHDEPDPAWLSRPDVRRGLAAVAAVDLAFDLLVRPRELPAATEVARTVPELRLVVDHAAKPAIARRQREEWLGLLRPLADAPQVDCKLSGLITEATWTDWRVDDVATYARDAIDLFGADRCMFGSDWPVCLVAGSYHDAVAVVERALDGASVDECDAVWGGSAERAYGLRPPAGGSS